MKTGMDEGDWEILLSRISGQNCTPFLGAGASAHLLPTGGALADRWADEVGYPLPERGDLARIAQYRAIIGGDRLRPKEIVSKMCREIDLASALQPGDPYDVIAGLELPVYVTTNYDDLLLQALSNKRKQPHALLCPWNGLANELAEETYAYKPNASAPIVYYLHGFAHEPGSIVLTEDDYLDFIVWVTRQWKEQSSVSYIAPAVKSALARNSLLFVGYSQNDWSFRVLMRTIQLTGANLGRLNIAVQLNPLGDKANEVDQDKVADYLTKYFTGFQNNPVKLYWGTADKFLKELRARMTEQGDGGRG